MSKSMEVENPPIFVNNGDARMFGVLYSQHIRGGLHIRLNHLGAIAPPASRPNQICFSFPMEEIAEHGGKVWSQWLNVFTPPFAVGGFNVGQTIVTVNDQATTNSVPGSPCTQRRVNIRSCPKVGPNGTNPWLDQGVNSNGINALKPMLLDVLVTVSATSLSAHDL